MNKYYLIFFENYIDEEPNRTFRKKLLKEFTNEGLFIFDSTNLIEFETNIRNPEFINERCLKILILDLMIRTSYNTERIRWISNGNIVDDSLIGAALLERCRNGFYDSSLKEIPIFIRTGYTSPRIRKLCFSLGANGFYISGDDDKLLQQKLSKIIVHNLI